MPNIQFTFFRLTTLVAFSLRRDAHIIIQGELVTVQHTGPWVPLTAHFLLTPRLDFLTQGTAGVNGPLQTHGGK